MPDYSADLAGPSAEQLQKVIKLSREQLGLQHECEEIQARLQTKLDALNRIAEVDLPEALSAAGLMSAPLGNGYSVEVKSVVVNASLKTMPETPEERERYEKAFAWLEKHKHGDLIKHSVQIFFQRTDGEWFRKFMEGIKKQKKPLDARPRDYIEPQALKRFVRENLKDPDFPRELFGVFERKVAVIIPPSNRK